MQTELTKLRRNLNQHLAEYQHACRQVERESSALENAQQATADYVLAQQLVQAIAEQVQQHAHQQIAQVVTRCLRTVFADQAYDFRIDFEQARGKTEAHLRFERNGVIIDEPLEEAGGGVIDVASLALRIACLMLSLPRKRRLLCLDEPLKHLNGTVYRERVAELLTTLAEELGIQIVMATGFEWLQIGKMIHLS